MKKRFTVQQNVEILEEGEGGVPVKEIYSKHN
jgi:hypothetical protein